jgi:hypothetical protein
MRSSREDPNSGGEGWTGHIALTSAHAKMTDQISVIDKQNTKTTTVGIKPPMQRAEN